MGRVTFNDAGLDSIGENAAEKTSLVSEHRSKSLPDRSFGAIHHLANDVGGVHEKYPRLAGPLRFPHPPSTLARFAASHSRTVVVDVR
ncbi:hypothetical protein ACVWYH_005659 [Bradyrhizobium sp. GM24.11]